MNHAAYKCYFFCVNNPHSGWNVSGVDVANIDYVDEELEDQNQEEEEQEEEEELELEWDFEEEIPTFSMTPLTSFREKEFQLKLEKHRISNIRIIWRKVSYNDNDIFYIRRST